MDIDICIDYMPNRKSHGSAVYIDENSLIISNFTVCLDRGEIIIDYPKPDKANELSMRLERDAIPLIRAEYERLSA